MKNLKKKNQEIRDFFYPCKEVNPQAKETLTKATPQDQDLVKKAVQTLAMLKMKKSQFRSYLSLR